MTAAQLLALVSRLSRSGGNYQGLSFPELLALFLSEFRPLLLGILVQLVVLLAKLVFPNKNLPAKESFASHEPKQAAALKEPCQKSHPFPELSRRELRERGERRTEDE